MPRTICVRYDVNMIINSRFLASFILMITLLAGPLLQVRLAYGLLQTETGLVTENQKPGSGYPFVQDPTAQGSSPC